MSQVGWVGGLGCLGGEGWVGWGEVRVWCGEERCGRGSNQERDRGKRIDER